MKESAIQGKIKEHLTNNGWLVLRLVNVQPFGIPDLLAIKDGTPLFIEVKAAKGKLSLRQAVQMQKVYKYGAHVVLADRVDIVADYIEMYINKNQ